MSHTKEPWILGKNSLTVLDKKTGFMIVNAYRNNLNRREDMRRIVACVNVCAGIPIDILEAMPNGPASLLPMYARLEKQRDELLAALEETRRELDA